MIFYVVRRVLAAIPIVLLVSVFIFSLVHLTPGDPAVLLAGDNASKDQIEEIRSRLGLDDPLPQQFVGWAGNALQFNLGQSVYSNENVTRLIAQRLEPTFVLAAMTLLMTVLLAIPLGIVAAWRANGLVDRMIMAMAVVGFSVPVFVVAYVLVYVFAVQLRWFPVQGYKSFDVGFLPMVQSVTLPATALSFVFIALIARVTRASMLEVLGENYIRTARAKGLGTIRILVVHALKSAGVPVVTVIGIGAATLLGGVVVTETVFNIPGIGRLTVDAVVRRDYPVVQGVMLFFSIALILINLLVDLSYSFIDPRVRG